MVTEEDVHKDFNVFYSFGVWGYLLLQSKLGNEENNNLPSHSKVLYELSIVQ